MYFSNLLPIAALVSVVSAGILEARGDSSSECSGSTQACCDQLLESNNPAVVAAASLLDIVLPSTTVLAGLSCDVASITSCTQQTVCCNNVYQNGLIVLGCSPISAL